MTKKELFFFFGVGFFSWCTKKEVFDTKHSFYASSSIWNIQEMDKKENDYAGLTLYFLSLY